MKVSEAVLRQARAEPLQRSFSLRAARAKGGSLTCSISSEAPYERLWGVEILSHEPGAVVLDRAEPDGLPFLVGHAWGSLPIARLKAVRIEAKRLKGSLVFGERAEAVDIRKDVENGTIIETSVGYEIIEMEYAGEPGKSEGEVPVFLVTKWRPLEGSFCGVAADATVGVGRSRTPIQGVSEKMDPEIQEALSRRERREERDGAEAERKRATTITKIGKDLKMALLAERAVAAGTSLDDFRQQVIAEMGKRSPVQDSRTDYDGDYMRGFTPNPDYSGFSVMRALRALIDPRAMSEAGFELEVSRDLTQRMGGAKAGGIMVPLEALTVRGRREQRAITVSGTGGYLVGTEHLGGEFVDVLRARSFLLRLAGDRLTGLRQNITIPRKTSSGTGYWFGGDDADSITESTPGLGNITLTPHSLGGLTRISHKTIIQSEPGIEELIRKDLADTLAVELDRAGLNGAGSGSEPEGILHTSGIGADTYSSAPTWDDVTQLESLLGTASADLGNLAHFCNSAFRKTLKNTLKATGFQQFIWEASPDGGIVNGMPAYCTENMPASTLLLGNFADLVVALWGGVELAVDPGGTNFAKGSISVRAILDADFAVRRTGSFAKLTAA